MVNPIAFGMIAIGLCLLLFGIRWIIKRRKIAGVAVSILGLAIAATPFLVSYFLAR